MFEGLTAEALARMQFAFTVSFHIIFPSFSIGLASFLAVLNALWLKTRMRPGSPCLITGKRYSPWCSAWASFPAL